MEKHVASGRRGGGFLTGQPTGYLGNGMEWNVRLGNAESGYIRGLGLVGWPTI